MTEHAIARETGQQFARAVLADFAPLGGARCWLSTQIAAEKAVRAMSTEPQRTCPTCGNEFSGAMEFCPVCMLRKGLAGRVESGESSASEDPIKPTPEQAGQRFEHYKLVTGEDGNVVPPKKWTRKSV